MLEDHEAGMPNHLKERMNEMLETNENIAPKALCTKTQSDEINSSDITRKLVKNYLIHLKRNRNKDAQLRKNTVAGVNKWAERHCDSDDVEDLEDGNKLIFHKCIASLTSVMILIATKNMLKLLQNNNLQLSLETTHSIT